MRGFRCPCPARAALPIGRAVLAWSAVSTWALAIEPAPPPRPHILWIVVEDMSPHFSCYGERTIQTPHVDALAGQGTRFTRAFVTAPVCSPSRSALITGMYQTSLGAHHHRSGRGRLKLQLPPDVEPLPKLLQQAGYYTANGSWPAGRGLGKTDYNFDWDPAIYDGPDWEGRRPGQPFFAQVQLHGGKLREGPRWPDQARQRLGSLTSADAVRLPPYYPSEPVLVDDWARYLDAVRYTDAQVGEILARLESQGLSQQTVVFFFTDHGISHARGKQFCYDEGLRIPLVVRGPGVAASAVRDELVEHIDLAATALGLAGVPLPGWMQGRDLLAAGAERRSAAFAARDRCDETVDRIRSVRTERYKYVRNFLPERPYLQPNAYKDHKPILQALRAAEAAGRLDAAQLLVFAARRPAEELYDLEADSWEVHNLAGNPAHAGALAEMGRRLNDWIARTGDQGAVPETPARYESEMEVYRAQYQRQPRRLAELESNIRAMRDRAAAGQ